MTLMPSSSSGRPKVKRAWPVCRSTPISPSQMPKTSAANPRAREGANARRQGHEGEHHEGEIIGWPELERPIHPHWREECDAEGADHTGDERADGRGRERRAGAAVTRHLVTLERRDDGGALAGRVEENRRSRAAVHRAVIDAGEKNECRGRLDLEGDRQEQRDGQRRAEAGKDADRSSQRGADQAPQEIHRSERDRKAVEKLREGIHLSCPPPQSAVRSWFRASRNRY